MALPPFADRTAVDRVASASHRAPQRGEPVVFGRSLQTSSASAERAQGVSRSTRGHLRGARVAASTMAVVNERCRMFMPIPTTTTFVMIRDSSRMPAIPSADEHVVRPLTGRPTRPRPMASAAPRALRATASADRAAHRGRTTINHRLSPVGVPAGRSPPPPSACRRPRRSRRPPPFSASSTDASSS